MSIYVHKDFEEYFNELYLHESLDKALTSEVIEAMREAFNAARYTRPATEWVIPNDDDAVMRPLCRVRNSDSEKWAPAKLAAVLGPDVPNRFYVFINGGIGWFPKCEIEKPEVPMDVHLASQLRKTRPLHWTDYR